MKAISKIAVGVVAAVGLGFAAAAFSHGPGMGYGGGMGYGPGGGQGMGMTGGYGMHGPYAGGGYGAMHGPNGFAGYDEQTLNDRLANLKTELKITNEQAKAWEAFETAVRTQAKSMVDMQTAMHSGQLTPEAHNALMQQRFAGREAVWKARGELVSVLTDEQKARFNRIRAGSYGRGDFCG